jgi:mono/diheme cytochrome c family protein
MNVTHGKRRVWLFVALPVLALGIVVAWVMLPPGALGFAGGHSVELEAYAGPTPIGVPAQLRTADLLTRGKYLTQAADCEVCHTAQGGQPFAGGRALPTPFGVLYTPNITPDGKTGIGTWTDEDFLRAVHRGIDKAGERLYPAFPYESYTLLADEDVLAIKAYLFSLPAVQATAPTDTLAFPFDQRWLMAIWSAFYNPNHRYRPHEDRSPEWNRGAYLVEGLGHCGDCHTPRNLGQALNNRHKFAGTVNDGWWAYNITSDARSGIGHWSDTQIIDYLHTGHAEAHGSAAGPMSEVVGASMSALEPTDLHAMVVYLRTVPAIHSQALPAPNFAPATGTPTPGEVSADSTGKHVFEEACASCHGWSGVSLLTRYATLTGARAVNDISGINVVQVVLSGEPGHRSDEQSWMPGFGGTYSDAEIAAVANYVTTRFGATPSHVSLQDVAQLRR